jgi:hypothetical protein
MTAAASLLSAIIVLFTAIFAASGYAAPPVDFDEDCATRPDWEDTASCEAHGGSVPVREEVSERLHLRIGTAEVEAQLRRAFERAPDATCELKIYHSGAVTICE